MAFTQATFAPVGANSAPSSATFSYSTSDTLAAVVATDYFADKKNQLRPGDFIMVNALDGGMLGLVQSDSSTVINLLSGGGGSSVYSYNRVTGTATQSVTSTLTGITWDSSSASSGTDVTFSLANPTRLTVASSGVYRVGGYASIESAAQRVQASAELIVNGTPTGLQRSGCYVRNSGFSYSYWALELAATPMTLTAGDYVELGVGQVTGTVYGYDGTKVINCHSSKSEFWLERVK